MKTRKILSLILALCLCLGLLPMTALAAPVYDADHKPTVEESWSHFQLQSDSGVSRDVAPIDLYNSAYVEEGGPEVDSYLDKTIDNYIAVNPETLFLIENTAPAGTNCYVTVEAEIYRNDYSDDGQYHNICDLSYADLTDDGMLTHEFYTNKLHKERQHLNPGEWATFRLHYQDNDREDGAPLKDGTIVMLKAWVCYPDCNSEGTSENWGRWWRWAYYIDSSVPVRDPNDPIVFPTVGQDKTKTEKTEESQPGYLTKEGINILLSEPKLLDAGVWYWMELTNTTDQPIRGAYGILFYDPDELVIEYVSEYNTYRTLRAQFMFFDLDLAPGETVKIGRNSEWWGLSESSALWLAFDSPEERESFVGSSPINRIHPDYLGDYAMPLTMDVDDGLEFLKDTFGITLGVNGIVRRYH